MARRVPTKAWLAIAAVFAALVGVVCTVMAVQDFYSGAVSHTRTTAYVDRVDPTRSNCAIDYSFTIGDERLTGSTYGSCDTKVGDHLQIRYDSSNPSTSTASSLSGVLIGGTALMCVGLLGLGSFALIVVTALRQRRRGWLPT